MEIILGVVIAIWEMIAARLRRLGSRPTAAGSAKERADAAASERFGHGGEEGS